jgi:hypothetical protein
MASKLPPPDQETEDQPTVDDTPPPAYNEATGTLDLSRAGVNAQSNIAG